MEQYGLIGYPLGHSFSKRYFTEKFLNEGIAATYELYELPDLAEFGTGALLLSNSALSGLNITIPYKAIIPFWTKLDQNCTKSWSSQYYPFFVRWSFKAAQYRCNRI